MHISILFIFSFRIESKSQTNNQLHAAIEWKYYRWWTSKDSAVYRAAVELTAVSRRRPWRPRWQQKPPKLLMLQPGGRTELQPPCWPTPLTPRPRHCAVLARSSPSDHLLLRSGSGSSYHLPTAHFPQETAPTHQTAGDGTRRDTSWPARPVMQRMMRRSAAGSRRPESLRPGLQRPVHRTATTTATSTAMMTEMMTTRPRSGKPRRRTNSGDGTAGGTWGACYRWWTWNSSLGDAARDGRLAEMRLSPAVRIDARACTSTMAADRLWPAYEALRLWIPVVASVTTAARRRNAARACERDAVTRRRTRRKRRRLVNSYLRILH